MFRTLARFIGLGGIAAISAAAPAQASINQHGEFEAARQAGTIEALENFAYRYPKAIAAVRLELAKFECAAGQQWRCGSDHLRSDPHSSGNQYGG